jgi:hypothetical protein
MLAELVVVSVEWPVEVSKIEGIVGQAVEEDGEREDQPGITMDLVVEGETGRFSAFSPTLLHSFIRGKDRRGISK